MRRLHWLEVRPQIAALTTFAFIGCALFAHPAAAQEVGVPTVGAMGITETVEQIMAREEVEGSTMLLEGDRERELPYPDRSLLPQDPASPETSQWPPPAPGDEIFHNAGPGHHGQMRLPQTVGTPNVLGTQISETPGFIPPDTEAAVGTDQIVVIVNGRIKTLLKTTGAADGVLSATTDSFFSSVRNGSGTSDPRVRFDRITNRWFVSILNVATPNRLMLAVSSGAHISSSASFTFYQFQHDTVGTTPNSDTGGFADYATLGVDANAVYMGANIFNASGTAFLGTTGYVIRKTSVLSGGPIVVTPFRQLATASGTGPYSPGGPDNDDPAATEGYFVGIDNASFGHVIIRRVSTPGGTPTISANISITVPSTASPIDPPSQGGNSLDALDDRHFNAMIHFDRISGVRTLWLAHNIQVNSSGVASSSGGRDGSRWYQIGSLTGAPALVQSGTMFDSAASNPRNFWIPSVAMSGQGHMAIGTSAAGAAEHAETAAAGRLRTDALGSTQGPTTLVTTSTTYNINPNRWGDYSHTFVDPVDDQTLWTSQEYCNSNNSWGVRITKLVAPPPAAPTTCSPSSVSTNATANVVVTGVSSSGSEFYDTDATYTQRLAAAVNGGGVTVNSVTWNSPTQLTMNITVAAGATAGARTVTVTNPDLQAATSAAGILTINSGGCTSPSITTNPSTQLICAGSPVTFSVVAAGTAPLTYQWRKNTVNIGGATSTSYTIASTVAGDAGSYDCVVTNACGNATTTAATLTISSGPSITGQPATQTVCAGSSVTLSVTANDTAALSYQWRKNTVNIGGATNTSLTFNPVAAGDAGSYDCVVTSQCGTQTSSAATLTVNTAPSISVQPASQGICTGSPVTFSVTASGTAPLSYQWRKNAVNIGGATNSSYTIPAVASGDAGTYSCVITNTCSSATSNNATLTVNSVPVITGQPVSQSANVGDAVSFNVTPQGQFFNFTYQWRRNSVNLSDGGSISGSQSNSLTIDPVAVANAGNYDCIVTAVAGGCSTTSNVAVLTVNTCTAPSVTGQPSPQTVCAGAGASFTVTATGTAPLSYQWRKNTVNISGATSATYSIAATVAGDAGSYDCIVTNTCGNVPSSAAALTVNTAAGVSSNPSSQTVCSGSSVSFSVAASGTAPFTYQWRKNTVNIGGATSATFTINPVTTGSAGSYDCVVTNSCGSATSSAATLTVNTPPSVTGQPSNQGVCAGSPASFTVTATGTAPLTYQWRKNTVNIGGATSATYSIAAVVAGDAGSYDCVVTNACGSATSNAATLTVNGGPAITGQPSDQSACSGSPASFTVVASGTAPITYQWRKNTVNIGGATSATYSIAATVAGDAGSYDCVVTNGCGSTTSNAATLTINAGPAITGQPSNQSACNGSPASFTVTATGTAPISYQWRKNTVNIGGATSATYSIAATVAGDAGSYDCVVTNGCGSTTSNAATLAINAGPAITGQPSNQTVCSGSPASFSVTANGAAPLSYQWRKGGVDIGGATSASYTINSVGPGDVDSYDCVVTNGCGSTTSNAATLTINAGPAITGQPASLTVCAGSPASFSVTANGTAPLSYQWRKGGVDIGGATSATYTIASTVAGDAGSYDCVVTNPCGSTTSDPATLTIGVGPTITLQPGNITTTAGTSITFSTDVSGNPADYTYQWRKGGSPLSDGGAISGAATRNLTINPTATTDSGSYDCVITSLIGGCTLTTNTATLTVNPAACFGDITGDRIIDLADLGILLSHYGQSPATYAEGDLDGNGLIDLVDLSLLLGVYGTSCP